MAKSMQLYSFKLYTAPSNRYIWVAGRDYADAYRNFKRSVDGKCRLYGIEHRGELIVKEERTKDAK